LTSAPDGSLRMSLAAAIAVMVIVANKRTLTDPPLGACRLAQPTCCWLFRSSECDFLYGGYRDAAAVMS
jgi:hypothetical protein